MNYRIITYFFSSIILIGILTCGFFVGLLKYYTVDFVQLEKQNKQNPTLVYDDEGELLFTFAYHKSDPIEFEDIPEHVIQAFVAAEDWNFFEHCGISFRGIIRSLLINLYKRRAVQGASTITQQLLKLVYFSHAKKFTRKIKEQFYALLIERHYTKEQIFQLYVNNVYFGCGIYGIKAAARAFWNKDVAELSLQEAALLAGVIRSPGNYCPLLFPLSSIARRNVVLGQMKKLQYITDEAYETLCKTPIGIIEQEKETCGLYLKELVRSTLEKWYDRDLVYAGGLTVRLTCNKTMQKNAEAVFVKRIEKLRKELKKECNGALIALEVSTGGIKVMVGGYSFQESQFNRAWYARRQQGSVFKPILYATGVKEGVDIFSHVVDEPLCIEQNGVCWEPKNYHKRHEGSMTIARGLVHSNNIVAIKLMLTVGAEKVKKLAESFHISGPILPYLSLALGCVDSTVKEVAGMFNVFAHDGLYVEPYYIDSIYDKEGKLLYRHEVVQERVLETKVAHKIARVLSCGMEQRKRRAKKWIDSDAISKTGTTNDSRNCWFAGSTPEISTVVYVGIDNNSPMGDHVFPTYTAYPIWLDFHKTLTTTKKSFWYDTSVLRSISINLKTGALDPVGSDPEVFEMLY